MNEWAGGWVWDVAPAPWTTFRDLLAVDERERRKDALNAILRWNGAEPVLWLMAQHELKRVADEEWEWDHDIAARRAAYHEANPGDGWDRRARS